MDTDSEAIALYRSLDLDPTEPAKLRVIAHRLLGEGSVRVVHAVSLPGDAALARVGDSWRVYLRRGLSTEQAKFGLAHELAEWHLRQLDYQEHDIEDVADRLAAALVAPAPAFRRLVRTGGDWLAVAQRLQSTESLVALRYGEVIGEPLALVARRVRVRGPETFVWPPEDVIRRAARRKQPGLGLRRAALRDDPHRVVLFAEEAV